MTNEEYMKIAIEEAIKGIKNGDGGPFGAVIVKDNGEIIGKGHNKVILNNDPTQHGEMEAIREASRKINNFNLSGCSIYTTGFPCLMCLSAIQWAEINLKNIFYGCTPKDIVNIGFKKEIEVYKNLCPSVNEKEILKYGSQIMRDECLEVFNLWKNNKDNIIY